MKSTNSRLLIFLFGLLLITSENTNACTIFCGSMNGEVLAAGNEDWSDPFSKIWISEKTTDRYGIVNLGHSDYQVQTAINEYGLYFDFAAIPKADGKALEGKIDAKTNMFIEILAKCKTIDEALIYLRRFKYPSPWNQILMADGEGNSVIVNQDTILRSQKDFQIATNFNTCKIDRRDANCTRFNIIKNGLSNSGTISLSLFRKLLSDTHQEGEYPTQYSYVFDLKNGVINLYSFHNFENVVTLNVREEIARGYRMIDLKELFPVTYEEEYFREHHRDSLTHDLVKVIMDKGSDAGLAIYKEEVNRNPDVASYPFVLLSVAGDLVHRTWFEDTNGAVFDYWFHPQNILQWKNVNKEKLKDILKVYDYLEVTIPKENPKQFIGTYELKGLLYYLIDEKAKSKVYFEKTIIVAPIETSNYQRAKLFLEEYFGK